MRIIKKLFALLSLVIVLVASACSSTKEINIEGSMSILIYKNSITIETKFEDSEDGLLANELAKIHVTVSDSEEKEVSRKIITVDTETLAGASVDVSNLEADSSYTVKLIASLDGNQKTLETKTITTINNGESLEDPIVISTKAELEAMSKEPEAFYRLDADLDFEGEELSAIFNSSNPFKGHLDGNNHTISNVLLDADTTYSGVFGYLKGAKISNLTIKGASFNASRGERYIAALAGKAEGAEINNVTIDGISVNYTGQTSKTAYIGGLISWVENSKISNTVVKNISITTPKARLKVFIGGFVGYNKNSVISNSSSVGTMKITVGYTSNSNGFAYVGGFVGLNDSSKGITTCYSNVNLTVGEVDEYSGNKTHSVYVGGFVGGNSSTVSKISDCLAYGDVTVTLVRSYNVYVGGLFGRLIQGSSIENCAYVPATNGVKLTLMADAVEGKAAQKAYVGLVGGYQDKYTKLTNVFATLDKFACTPVASESNQIIVNSSTISTDLSKLSESITNIIQK